jgi:phosphate uptake regulator
MSPGHVYSMEIRKVQVSGGSSYIVSLPKNWIRATNIKKNDPVGVITQTDGTLLITPNIHGQQVQKTKEFSVDAGTDQDFFLRCLIGAYISGYNVIRVRAKGRLPPFVTLIVRDFTNMAIGQEVIEETENSITLRDLLNPAEMPFDNTIRRMVVILKGRQEDAINALMTRNSDLAANVIERDTDIDRLHWLIARQNHLILSDVNLSRKMNVPVRAAQDYYLVSRIIERMADHGTRIAKNVRYLISQENDEALYPEIQAASSLSVDLFLRSIDSFFDEEIQKANTIIGQIRGLEDRCRKISTRAMGYEARVAMPMVYITDSLRRIGDYSADICETVINQVVGQEDPKKG